MSGSHNPICLVILAGGQSRRMGIAKATIRFGGQKMIDRLIARYEAVADQIIISGPEDFGTGLAFLPDNPDTPGGPVGAIYTIAEKIGALRPGNGPFVTIPVDAPFSPDDLITKLSASGGCAVAEGAERLHPTFACWDPAVVNAVRHTHETEDRAPSLHWLARQCQAETVSWDDDQPFFNINTPEELAAAEALVDEKPAHGRNVYRLR
ncbi:MAG: molybdenum cofactor guanylyltransferase [Pseudomonadota bacterium]